MSTQEVEIYCRCSELYLRRIFQKDKPKMWKCTNLLGRQVAAILLRKCPQNIRFCGNLSKISKSFHELEFSPASFGSLFYKENFHII